MLPKIIRTGYHAIHLVYFFTAGSDEVRAWTIHVRAAAAHTAACFCG
jgi:obg-like ATPase 1